METLSVSLAQANHIIEKLSVFKSTTQEQDIFKDESLSSKKVDLEIHPKSILEYDIAQAEKLSHQFCEMIDCQVGAILIQLDDFEFGLSQLMRKKEILTMVNTANAQSDGAHRLELRDLNVGFKKRINEIKEEQTLLNNHLNELKNKLDTFSDNNTVVKRISNDGLRRYCARVMFSTDKGATFQPFKNAPLCVKCAEKTVICPHRIEAHIIQIPEKASHLKFDQIPLKFKSNLVKMEQEKKKYEETENDILKIEKTYGILWHEYYDVKNAQKPKLTRIFVLPKLLSFILEIYNARWSFEEGLNEEECWKKGRLLKFGEFFYNYMGDRYQYKDVSLKPIYDMFSSLYANKDNLRCKFFAKTLAGEDDCNWKYMILAEKLLSKYEPLDMKSYRQFLQVLYPSRSV